MRRTVLCIVPSHDGAIHDAFSLANEYCRICEGVLGSRHRIHVLCCKESLFSRGDPLSKLSEPTPRSVTASEIIGGLTTAMQILSDKQGDNFRVGRLILLFNDASHFLNAPNPLNLAYLLGWIDQTIATIKKEQFDDLNVDVVTFARGPPVDGLSTNRSNRAIVAAPECCLRVAHEFAQCHLKLSSLVFKSVGFYFLDLFEQKDIVCTQAKDVPKSLVLNKIEQVCPCVLRANQPGIVEALATDVIIFEDQYLVTAEHGRCLLSYVSSVCDQETIDECAFDIPSEAATSIVARMVHVLKIGESGTNWIFKRNLPSPALSCLSQLASLGGCDSVLFSPGFLHQQRAFELLGPILAAVGKPNMPQELLNKAKDHVWRVFECIRNDDLTFLPPEMAIPQRKAHSIQRLIYEMNQVLAVFKDASHEHAQLHKYFIDWASYQQSCMGNPVH